MDESGQMHFRLCLCQNQKNYSSYIAEAFYDFAVPSQQKYTIGENGHLQNKYTKTLSVESGHSPFECFKAGNTFRNDSASLYFCSDNAKWQKALLVGSGLSQIYLGRAAKSLVG